MTVFGLIDGNSFYCSVEQAFAPELRGKPLIVLSNNDGCAIARSALAKAAGVKMGDPWHLISRRPELKSIVWRSSNYALYGDISRRFYDVLVERCPLVEPYSIDEMFLDLEGVPDLDRFCRRLRDDVRQLAKVPTCIGLGPTKTIAKLANRVAKNRPELAGICDLQSLEARSEIYDQVAVGDVWGIGGKTAQKLERMGVLTIADFIRLDPRMTRDMLTVVGSRIQAELRGQSCLPLSLMVPTRKGIAVTRSFGKAVSTWAELREAVASYAARAAEKLRAEKLQVSHLSVFAHTNPHNGDPWYSAQRGAQIEPTADSGALIGESTRLLKSLWRPGFRYSKAGVILADLVPSARQGALFLTRDPVRSAKVMAAFDAVNARYGRGAIRMASTGINRAWSARQQKLSPRYTTRLSEILVARAF